MNAFLLFSLFAYTRDRGTRPVFFSPFGEWIFFSHVSQCVFGFSSCIFQHGVALFSRPHQHQFTVAGRGRISSTTDTCEGEFIAAYAFFHLPEKWTRRSCHPRGITAKRLPWGSSLMLSIDCLISYIYFLLKLKCLFRKRPFDWLIDWPVNLLGCCLVCVCSIDCLIGRIYVALFFLYFSAAVNSRWHIAAIPWRTPNRPARRSRNMSDFSAIWNWNLDRELLIDSRVNSPPPLPDRIPTRCKVGVKLFCVTWVFACWLAATHTISQAPSGHECDGKGKVTSSFNIVAVMRGFNGRVCSYYYPVRSGTLSFFEFSNFEFWNIVLYFINFGDLLRSGMFQEHGFFLRILRERSGINVWLQKKALLKCNPSNFSLGFSWLFKLLLSNMTIMSFSEYSIF